MSIVHSHFLFVYWYLMRFTGESPFSFSALDIKTYAMALLKTDLGLLICRAPLALRPRGLLVSFGASSGPPPLVDVGILNAKGSLFLTRPSIAAHTADTHEYRERASDVLESVKAGIIRPNIWRSYPLSEVSAAHAAMETGKSAGAIVLRP